MATTITVQFRTEVKGTAFLKVLEVYTGSDNWRLVKRQGREAIVETLDGKMRRVIVATSPIPWMNGWG
jgi:hypothetical protein